MIRKPSTPARLSSLPPVRRMTASESRAKGKGRPGGRGMTFRPTVLEAVPGHRLRWLGRLLVPGLFDGEHTFAIKPLSKGRVRLVQQETFRGLLVGPMTGLARQAHAARI